MKWLFEGFVIFLSVAIGVAISLLTMVIISGLVQSFVGR